MIQPMNFRTPTDQDIHTAFEQGEAAVRDLVYALATQIEALGQLVTQQGEALQTLQARLAKDSRNSSKPPASDGYRKVKRTESLRQSGAKPNGGQPGHEGHTLSASDAPDCIEMHGVEQCARCQASLMGIEVAGYEERQVFDIPALRIAVTAHRAEITVCPACGHPSTGPLPDAVTHALHYGPTVAPWASSCTNYHHIPVERTTEIFDDLVRYRVSDATVLKASEHLDTCIAPATEAVKEQLRASEVLHVDESGVRVEGKLYWLHVASTDTLTHYEVHAKRGHEAIEAAGILGAFRGTAVHAHWTPSFHYTGCAHALCHAPHLRELQCIHKQYQQPWANDMAELRCERNAAVDKPPAPAVS
jgi:transposase